MVYTSTVLKEFLNSGETKAPQSGYNNFLQDMFFFMSCTRFGKEEKIVEKPSMPSPIQEITNSGFATSLTSPYKMCWRTLEEQRYAEDNRKIEWED